MFTDRSVAVGDGGIGVRVVRQPRAREPKKWRNEYWKWGGKKKKKLFALNAL